MYYDILEMPVSQQLICDLFQVQTVSTTRMNVPATLASMEPHVWMDLMNIGANASRAILVNIF